MNLDISNPISSRLRPFGTTIFTEMTALANQHKAVNLAQGFPDFDGPAFIKDAAIAAIHAGHNQYARMFGVPVLNDALATAWRERTGQTIDPMTQITVTSGCTEAICATMAGLLEPGDEVILFEPYYDSYRASVEMAGGVCKFVTLHAPKDQADPTSMCTPLSGQGQFWFEPKQLAAAFSSRTKLVLVNTPHNPTGKVFSLDELALIAELCQRHNVLAVTDEVYEHLLFNPEMPHISLATLPGMADRTLTLSSLGKSFSLTGWKVGWAIGPVPLNRAIRAAHQFMTFATATPLQFGAAEAVGMSPAARQAIAGLVSDLRVSRDVLAKTLREIGFTVFMPAGAYFIMVDWTKTTVGGKVLGERFADDLAFCKGLTQDAGVAAIPPSVFYEHKQHGRALARFAFCKKLSTMEEGCRRLRAWAGI